MKVEGHDAYFKDGVLAMKQKLNMKTVRIDGVHYNVLKVEQSLFNKEVFNYYLEKHG